MPHTGGVFSWLYRPSERQEAMVYRLHVALSSHEWLRMGITEKEWVYFIIEAPTDEEAHLTALQWAYHYGYPTRIV